MIQCYLKLLIKFGVKYAASRAWYNCLSCWCSQGLPNIYTFFHFSFSANLPPIQFENQNTFVTSRRSSEPSSQWMCRPKIFPTSGFDLIDPSIEMEEETMFGYNPDNYYPVKQGEILNNRYQIIGKIGYGTTSTVWLAKDLTYVQWSLFQLHNLNIMS